MDTILILVCFQISPDITSICVVFKLKIKCKKIDSDSDFFLLNYLDLCEFESEKIDSTG